MNFYDYRVSSDYGYRSDPITNQTTMHNGIDYAIPLNTDITSNVTGEVIESTSNSVRGEYVVIKDGTGRMHYYQHLNKRNVNVGDIVEFGDSIGLSGSTGKSTGAHLHYEIRNSLGQSIDPDTYLGTVKEAVDTLGEETVKETVTNPNDITVWDIKGKLKAMVFNIFKFVVIALIIVLFVIFITKALDINIF